MLVYEYLNWNDNIINSQNEILMFVSTRDYQ